MRRGAETAGAPVVDLNRPMGCAACYPNYWDGCPSCGADTSRDRRYVPANHRAVDVDPFPYDNRDPFDDDLGRPLR